jgi:hypothetical protein
MSNTPASRRWVWFFLFLVVMGIVAATTTTLYNLSLQLKPEQLAAARQRWQEKGSEDYDLDYEVKTDRDPSSDVFEVQVRQGRIARVKCNGETVTAAHPEALTVSRMFAIIERNLENDTQPGQRRTYARAFFDPQTGYPLLYIRRLPGTDQRLEWSMIRVRRVGELP